MRLFLLGLLLSASVAVAQSTDVPKNARLEGRVLSTTGEPIKSATLLLAGRAPQPGQPATTYSQSSDNDGRFVFEALPPGTYLVVARKDGFSINTSAPIAPITLSSAQVMKDLIIKLIPLGVITGRVTDQDGDPVTSAQVRALRYTYTNGHKQLANVGGGITDDQGNFRVFNLTPGLYYLNAIPRPSILPIGTQPVRVGDNLENIITYYPSGLGPGSATSLNLLAGGELRGIDIRVRKGRVYSIRGKTVDKTHEGAAVTARVSLSSKEDSSVNMSSFPQTARPSDGTFEFRNLTPGTYVLQVRPLPQPGGQVNTTPNGDFIGRMEVTINDSDVDGVVLPLMPASAFDITGSISVEGGDFKELAGLLRGPRNDPAPLSMVFGLREVEGMSGVLNAKITDDGIFRTPLLLPSRYLLDFTPLQAFFAVLATPGLGHGVVKPVPALSQGVYVKSVRFAGQDVTHAPLDFTSVREGSLQILLSAKAAMVTANARDSQGNAIPSARIALWPKSPDLGSPTGGVRFIVIPEPGVGNRINGLAPGDYYLAAWDDLDINLLDNSDFLNLSARDASSVKLEEGANETVDVKLISKEKIAAAVAALP